MKQFKPMLLVSGVSCFGIALVHIAIGFSPSLSVYFGAPPALAANIHLLLPVWWCIGMIIGIFGLYALSGAGYIRALPWLKQVLVGVSGIFILRGLLVVPEALVVAGMVPSAIHVAPRFIAFSIGSLLIGICFVAGTVGGWRAFPSTY